ncbi:MAG TPA: dynamin family protein [Burkholderiales bacterium]|nr:dynamin family protein [Burkholderiales bacterium]
MNSVNLVERFQLYSSWRFAVGQAVTRYRDWISEAGLIDTASASRINRVLERLAEDKLSIAFVAEFSRGKSELINAIFFADYGRRILPSSAGRTTMCPTELMYTEGESPELRLLPIETRAKTASVSEYKQYPEEWVTHPLDTSSGDAMLAAFKHVSQVKRVSVETAKELALFDEKDPDQQSSVGPDGLLEIPSWRHAVINFPHPLLAQGLVILDTPGLNAIGSEPELTLNLIPSAHAVLFVLAADTGVTKSDIQVWREHIGGGEATKRARMVVLNKIDGLWDELKTQVEIDAEIDKQAGQVASMLALDVKNVFPISAQKGLVAKVHSDPKLLAKSRLPRLEAALSEELIPAKQDIVRDFVAGEMRDVVASSQSLLASRMNNVKDQLRELEDLQGKNEDVMQHMLQRVRTEKETFEKSLLQFAATRSVLARSTNTLFRHLGMEAYRDEVKATHGAIDGAAFSAGVLEAMRRFFKDNRELFEQTNTVVAEITTMMQAMYKKFGGEFGLRLAAPAQFSMLRYLKEVDRVEESFTKRFGAMSMITEYKRGIATRFFGVVASRIQSAFEVANRDAEAWLKAVMNPLESQIKERQQQLRRRLDSIKRIHDATDTLEDRVQELHDTEKDLTTQVIALDHLREELDAMLAQEMINSVDSEQGFDLTL